jgi:sulfatase maturation enzyme AslB (radical SAM superfamily)
MKVLEVNKCPALSPNDFGITWEVTGNCTYDCRYCVLHYKEPYHYPTKTLEFINNLSKTKNIILTLFGGEPTAHPDFLKILNDLDPHIDLGIFTNLSKGESYFQKILDIRPNIKFETSFHPSQVDFKSYYNKIKFLMSKNAKVAIAFMYDTNFSMLKEYYSELCALCPDVTLFKIDYPDQNISMSDMSWILEENKNKARKIKVTYDKDGLTHTLETTPGFLWANNINNFKYYRCDCGKSCFYISSQGDVYPCLDYKKKNLGKFFSVNEEYSTILNKVLEQGLVCVSDECTSEIDVRKQRILNL